MIRKYIIENIKSIREKFKILINSEKISANKLCQEIIDLMSDKKAGEFYIDFCIINDIDPIIEDDEDEQYLKRRLIKFIDKNIFNPDDVLTVLVDYVSEDILETVIDYYDYDMFITEGKWRKRLATGILVGSALVNGLNTVHASEYNTNVKEISSSIFTRDIQKQYNINNAILDSKSILKLAEDIKTQIKMDWEKYGYDNTLITKTNGWNDAIEIRDTLESISPWLCAQFKKSINFEMHNKLKVTPIL